jgi:predicted ATPase
MYRFVNFKSFADATLDLDRAPVTVLIGRNGSGKSNAIEALTLLASLVQGTPLSAVETQMGDPASPLRGGLRRSARFGTNAIELKFDFVAQDGRDVSYTLNLHIPAAKDSQSKSEIASESLSFERDGQRKPYNLDLDVGLGLDETGRFRVQSNVVTFAHLVHGNTLQSKYAKELLTLCHVPILLTPVPDAMRDYVPVGSSMLEGNCRALASVLHGLRTDRKLRPQLERIVETLRDLPAEPLEDIITQPTPSDDVTFVFRMHGQDVPARLLSDGTLRALAIVTAVETAPRGRTLVIEDFADQIHPSRAGVLLNAIWDAAKRNGLRVLLTTHDPATLNALNAEQMKGVVLCWWDQDKGASQLAHLSDLPDSWPLMRPGHLGDDATTERYVSRLIPAEEYTRQRAEGVAKNLADLESLSSWRGDK